METLLWSRSRGGSTALDLPSPKHVLARKSRLANEHVGVDHQKEQQKGGAELDHIGDNGLDHKAHRFDSKSNVEEMKRKEPQTDRHTHDSKGEREQDVASSSVEPERKEAGIELDLAEKQLRHTMLDCRGAVSHFIGFVVVLVNGQGVEKIRCKHHRKKANVNKAEGEGKIVHGLLVEDGVNVDDHRAPEGDPRPRELRHEAARWIVLNEGLTLDNVRNNLALKR